MGSLSKDEILKLSKKTVILILIMLAVIFIVIVIGAFFYKTLFNMDTVDAVYNSMLTASTLGVDPHEKTTAEKMFTGIYGLCCAVLLITFIGSIVAYLASAYYQALLD